MPFKLNISNKGKAWKLELENEALVGKSIGDKLPGNLIKPDLEGYELEITGGSDFAGFPMYKEAEGIGLKKVILTKGWGMWSKPKGEGKKTLKADKGLRLRKTVRGKIISDKSVQINIIVLKEGSKKLEEIFPDQNKPKDLSSQQGGAPHQSEEAHSKSETENNNATTEEKPVETTPTTQ